MPKTLRMIRRLCLVSLVAWSLSASAGTISGKLSTASSGPVANATLTLTLSQAAYVSGTSALTTQAITCGTDDLGMVRGIVKPLIAPSLSVNTSSGTLPAATYYVKVTYYNTTGGVTTETPAAPEASIVLSSPGKITVAAPTLQPSGATGYKVYISTSTGTETLQGTVTGWSSFVQQTPLAVGTALPASNNTVCKVYFSDELVPTGTAYAVNVRTRSGTQLPGFPQNWCTYGGTNGTIDISSGAPSGNCGSSGVFYPTPILASGPSVQSIAGSLNVGGDLTVSGALNVASLNLVGANLTVNSITATSYLINGNTITAPAGSATYTLPSVSTTLIGANTAETLTNKTLSGPTISAATISGSSISSTTLTSDTLVSPTVNTGVANNGSGFKHKRFSTGSISASTTSPIAFTWTSAFADTNYTVVCSVEDSAAQLTIASAISAKTGAGFTISVKNNDAGGAHSGTVDCMGVHD